MLRRISETPLGLKSGAAILVAVALGFAAVLLSRDSAAPIDEDRSTSDAINLYGELDPVSARYLAALDRAAPDIAGELRPALQTLMHANREDIIGQRRLVLMAGIAAYRDHGIFLRRASVDQFDRIIAHFERGVTELSEAGSPWCNGPQVEAFLRLHERDLIPKLVDEVAASRTAYDWALDWNTLFLDAVETSKAKPVLHGRRTTADKALLQQTGMTLGPDRWALALQIAAFSRAEGQDYETMRSVIEGIDVCEMGLAMTELSTRIPHGPRGRIWAQLLPEIFVGNTPYVLYVLNDYFFLDPA